MFETFLLLWLPLSVLVGWLAGQKGRSGFGFFFLSLFFSPLIGLLAVIAVPSRVGVSASPDAPSGGRKGNDFVLCHNCSRPRRVDSMFCPHCQADPTPASTKTCPRCAETIQRAALVCRFCGADQEPAKAASQRQREPSTMGYCPGCRKLRGSNVAKCLYCGDTAPVVPA